MPLAPKEVREVPTHEPPTQSFDEGKIEVQGETKITREAGDSNTGKLPPDAVFGGTP